jgi:hypothetical protein
MIDRSHELPLIEQAKVLKLTAAACITGLARWRGQI